jgi:hypothetical protein
LESYGRQLIWYKRGFRGFKSLTINTVANLDKYFANTITPYYNPSRTLKSMQHKLYSLSSLSKFWPFNSLYGTFNSLFDTGADYYF